MLIGLRLALHQSGMRCGIGKPTTARRFTQIATCIVALRVFGLCAYLHAQSNQAGSREAALHISAVVMPVVQAFNIREPQRQSGTVTYNLDTAPLEKRYEVRSLPADVGARNTQAPAILQTLVVVPQ